MSKTLALMLAGLIVASPLQAATAWYSGQIRWVYPQGDGSVVIGVDSAQPVCSAGSGSVKYLFIAAGQNGVTIDGAKNMLAVALSASAMSRVVQVAYDDASSYCYVARLLMTDS